MRKSTRLTVIGTWEINGREITAMNDQLGNYFDWPNFGRHYVTEASETDAQAFSNRIDQFLEAWGANDQARVTELRNSLNES